MIHSTYIRTTRTICGALAMGLSILALAASGLAQAQAWPTKTVRIVVPFSVGASTDLLARVLGQAVSQATGQAFVIENKTGASGAIAAAEVARAPADGYTLLLTTSSTHAVAPHLNKLPYNTVTDFTPIAHLADSDLIMLASPSLGVKNVAELLELARSKPGYVNYTSSGVGTIAHLSFELFCAQTGVVMNHIPYKGTGSAMPDLRSGVVHLSLEGAATGIPQMSDGKVRGLAVTGLRRAALAPNMPTIAETVPGFSVVPWYGLYGPRGMSPELVHRIHGEFVKVIQSPEMLQRFKSFALEPGRGSPADFAAMVASDSARWAAS
jgi:tripartite-type tricarboxylate transporter receptor subunit TctC